jgi:D-serine deaminase-like pyridoxal phosphate-dependent protein
MPVSGCAPTMSARSTRSIRRRGAGVTFPVYVEVNMGGNRCGVEPGEPALALARQITQAPHLVFGGLQAYRPITARRSICGGGRGAARRSPGPPTRRGAPVTSWRAVASSARRHRGAAPAPSSSNRRAASTPNCSAAPTSSWTPITAATSTATTPRPRPSSRASSYGRQ